MQDPFIAESTSTDLLPGENDRTRQSRLARTTYIKAFQALETFASLMGFWDVYRPAPEQPAELDPAASMPDGCIAVERAVMGDLSPDGSAREQAEYFDRARTALLAFADICRVAIPTDPASLTVASRKPL